MAVNNILEMVRQLVVLNINKLVEWARSFAARGYKLYARRHNKLQELAEELDQIKDIMDVSGTGGVDDHLWQLKDAIHDAEELLDAFQFETANTDQIMKKRCLVIIIGTNASLNKLKKLMDDLPKLRRSLQELPEVSQRGSISRSMTRPQPAKDKLFGYGKEYTALLSSLVPDKDAEYSDSICSVGDARVVAIIGHGGTGKTELARWAFDHEEKVKANFDLRIWVCVYAKFTETDLLSEIWMSSAGRAAAGKMNVTSLQQELTKIVKSARRYLLVLDDVCNDESVDSDLSRRKAWDVVLAPFKQHGGRGSRILMTTRAEICSTTLDAGSSIVLNGINTYAITLLLKKTVLGDEHANIPRELQEVLHNNVGKLHGSPSVAEEVGRILRGNRDSRKWTEILTKDDHEGVYTVHLSSYQDLPPHLKRCFAFCSIFPMKWRFEPENLVNMWLAHGFVEVSPGPDGRTREEDVARGYFDALVKRSFFHFEELSSVNGESGGGCYVIHEHIHSMLRQVAPHYYLTIDGPCEAAEIPPTVRHLSVTTGCVHQLEAYPPDWLKKLRTLLVYRPVKDDDDDASSTSRDSTSAFDKSILGKFKDVRVLDLSDTCIAQVPESIRKLKHLRYLGLPNTIKELGGHVTKLLLLRTLGVVSQNCELQKLPRDLSSLINLRHLDMDVAYIAQIGGIGSMEKLQGSVEFHAGRRKMRHRMRELEKLNSLRRTLTIKGLETLQNKGEAESAHLAEKEHLEVLKLEWSHRSEQQAKTSAGSGKDSIILAGLRPHPNLQELHITRYQGTTWPGWLADARALQNLRSLYLRNCRKLQALPPVGELSRLELLHIRELRSVERIDGMFCGIGAFRSLEKMVLNDMPVLLAWDAPEPATSGDSRPILFPQLRHVEIFDCPKLSSLSGLLCCRTSLSVLCVKRCPAVKAIFSTSNFPSLVKPDIKGCPGLQFQG